MSNTSPSVAVCSGEWLGALAVSAHPTSYTAELDGATRPYPKRDRGEPVQQHPALAASAGPERARPRDSLRFGHSWEKGVTLNVSPLITSKALQTKWCYTVWKEQNSTWPLSLPSVSSVKHRHWDACQKHVDQAEDSLQVHRGRRWLPVWHKYWSLLLTLLCIPASALF